ncbi:MAG: hypothetical protein NW703_06975 [Nitrospiraceae bacterium]
MDQQDIQTKVQAFAQRLLVEAKGDAIRALGLLVLVLDGVDTQDVNMVNRLISEVRRILMPSSSSPIVLQPSGDELPIQHLAGDLSWEGIQHCIRCGKVLVRDGQRRASGLPPGYVYQVGTHYRVEDFVDFRSCKDVPPC